VSPIPEKGLLSGTQASLALRFENKSITTQMSMGHWYSDTDRENPKYLNRKTYPNSTLSNTKPTWNG
jgi:hypothetical protein